MASTRLVYILDENTLSRGKLVAIFDRTGVGVEGVTPQMNTPAK